MKDSKLYLAIHSLSSSELRQIRKMLKSPFFTTRADLQTLFEVLVKHSKQEKSFPDPYFLHRIVFPGKTPDEVRLRGTMSDLLVLIEECWLINLYRSNKIQTKLELAEIYRRRNLEKAYQSTIKKSSQLLEDQTVRNASYYQQLLHYQTTQMKYQSTTKRTAHLYLQEISDTQDIRYLIEKLQITCAQLSHQLVYKTTYDYGLLKHLFEIIEQNNYIRIPAIAIYYYCFRFLTESENLDYFHQFKEQLNTYRSHFTVEDLEAPYRLALNLCIRKVNMGETIFLRESWELYKEGLSVGILLENNYIPRFTFNNVIATALNLKEFDWIDSFISESTAILEPTYKDQTISFNLVRLAYARGQFHDALLHLQNAEYKDLVNNLIAKMHLVKIYLELDEFDALEAHLDSFQQFIRRREVSDFHRKNFLQIIRFVRRLVGLSTYDREGKINLRSDIISAEVSEREWLLSKTSN